MENTVEQKGLQLADLKVSNLPELQGWKEKQEALVEENPYVEVTDNKTYDVACKSRTALLKGRTELEKQDKFIASQLTSFRKDVKSETDKLIEITKPHEERQQIEVKRYEGIKEAERAEAARIELERVDGIKTKIDEFETESLKLIQGLTFGNISGTKDALNLLAANVSEFDFEEFDILLETVKSRNQIAFDSKHADVVEKEAQRVENDRLAQVAKEAEDREKLQADRLTEFLPLVGFGQEVNMTKLWEIDEEVYQALLKSKKDLFDADAKQKEDSIEEEKDSIYGIRKNRLEEIGMKYSEEHDTMFIDDDFISLKEDIRNCDSIGFENLLKEASTHIKNSKVKESADKMFDIRKNRLAEIGVFYTENTVTGDLLFADLDCSLEFSHGGIYYADAIDFETIITDAKLSLEDLKAEKEAAKKQKVLDDKKVVFEKRKQVLLELGFVYEAENDYFGIEGVFDFEGPSVNDFLDSEFEEVLVSIKHAIGQKKKSDADAAKKANEARVGLFLSDKKSLRGFVEELEFHGTIPEVENNESEEFLQSCFVKLMEFKKGLLTEIENL